MSSNYFGNDGATQFQGGGYGGYARARLSFFSLFLSLSLSFYVLSFFFFFFFFFSRWVSIFEKMIQNRGLGNTTKTNALCCWCWCCAFSSFSLPENVVTVSLFADATSD